MSTGIRNLATGGLPPQPTQTRVVAHSLGPRDSNDWGAVAWHQWLPLTVLACIAILNLVGMLLLLRRFVGALQEPFPTGPMLFTALITTILAATTRNIWRRTKLARIYQKEHLHHHHTSPGSRWDRRTAWNYGTGWDQLVGWGSSAGLIFMAVGCAYPANHLSDWLIWLPLLVADQFWRQSFFDGGRPTIPCKSGSNRTLRSILFGLPHQPMVAGGEFRCATSAKDTCDNVPDSLSRYASKDTLSTAEFISDGPQAGNFSSDEDEQILQQLFRIRNQAGQETIYGTLRAEFKTGQRNASLYVGFCPPLPHPPQVEAEPIDGPAATLKVVQALAHGTRVDLRLDQPAEQECHVLVDLAALGVPIGL